MGGNALIHHRRRTTRANDSEVSVLTTRLAQLIEWRTPWLIVGLFGGMLATGIVSSFEAELSRVLPLAFFIPVMVYMGDALGTQTEMLFVRQLSQGRVKMLRYLGREFCVDVVIGAISACVLYFFASLISTAEIATVVSIALFLIMSTAGVISILLSWLLVHFHRDPAIGGGPFATIVQDITSLLIYFAVASVFIM